MCTLSFQCEHCHLYDVLNFTEVTCKEEMKQEEEEEPIENNVHAELRVRSSETLTDANRVLVDLRSNFHRQMNVNSDERESNVEEQTSNDEEQTPANSGMQYVDPCSSQREEPANNFTYATEEYIEILEDDPEDVPTETFEESDIKYKQGLQTKDFWNDHCREKAQRERQGQDIETITLIDEDFGEDIQNDDMWLSRLTYDQDKKFFVKSEVQDDSDIEIVYVEDKQPSSEQNEPVRTIHEESTSDETSSSISKDKKKTLRRRSFSSGRKQRLPSSSDDDDEPSERDRSSKPKTIHRSRLENFRESIILKDQTKLEKTSKEVSASSGRRTRSMSRGAGTDFLMLPDNYKEQPLRNRSRSNVKARSKSREKRPRKSRSKSNVKSRNKSREKAPRRRRSKSNVKSRSKSREKSSPSNRKQRSHQSRKPSPKAAVNVENRRRTRSMTRNEETEFVSLPQDYGRRRSSSRPKEKPPVPEIKEDGQPKGETTKLQDTTTVVNVPTEESRKIQENKSAAKTSKSIELKSKEPQQRSSKNDTKRQADSKLASSSPSSKKKRHSTSQSSREESSKTKKPSEPKSSLRVSDPPVRKRTRSPSNREENLSPKKKSKSLSTDFEKLFGADDLVPEVTTKVPVERREPVDVHEEMLNKEPLVDSPRTISETTSNISDSRQVEKDSEVTTTASGATKRIQVIDPLPLTLKRQRRSSLYSSAYRTDDEGETEEKDSSSGKKLDEPKESAKKADEPKRTSAQQKLIDKEKADEKARQRKEYEIEKKRRHQRYPWANIPGLKTSAPSSKLTPTEKRENRNIAKEKLAQKTTEKPKPKVQQRSAPRVKVCLKSRGDMLCEDMVKSASDNKENNKPDKDNRPAYVQNFMRSILKKKTGPEAKKNVEETPKKKKKITFSSTISFFPFEEKGAGQEDILSSIENADENQIMEPVMFPDEEYPSSPEVHDSAGFQDENIPVSVVTSPKDHQEDHPKDDRKDQQRDYRKDHRKDHKTDDRKDHRKNDQQVDRKDHRKNDQKVDRKDRHKKDQKDDQKSHRKNEKKDDRKDHRKNDQKDDQKSHRKNEQKDDRRHKQNDQKSNQRHDQNDHHNRHSNEPLKYREIARDANESEFRLVFIILQWNPRWILVSKIIIIMNLLFNLIFEYFLM